MATPNPRPTATPTPGAVLTISPTATMAGIPRIGLNLGSWSEFGAEQVSSNIAMNPGFEPLIDRAVVTVQDSYSTGFSDDLASMARPDGFWNGATFEVRTGASAGTDGTIASSQEAGSDGLPWFTTSGPAPTLAAGDIVSVTQTQISGGPYNWFWPAASDNYVAINTTDHRPSSPGTSVAELTLQSGQSTELDAYWDAFANNLPDGKFLQVNGNWQLSFWARSTSGSPTVKVTFERAGSSPFLSQTVTLTSTWQQFVMNFSATDNGPKNPLWLSLVASGTAGTAVRLDDVQLGRPSDFPNPWRAEVVQALRILRPGYLRDWQSQLGDTMTNRLAPIFGRGSQRWQPDPSNILYSFLYGLPDFLSLCQQVGAQPWIVLPNVLYDAEFTQLGKYLATAESTYGFTEIVVEFGDENFNPVFRGGSIPDPVHMAEAANRGFALLRAAAGSSVPLHLVINGLFVNPLYGSTVLGEAPQADAVDVAPYYLLSMNSKDTQATSLDSMFSLSDEAECVPQLQSAQSVKNKTVDIYELNAETTGGDAPADQRNPLDAGMISGAALVNRLIEGMNLGVRRQSVFAMTGYDDTISATIGSVYLWGVTRDLNDDSNMRPTGLALEMLNDAINGDFHKVSVSGTGSSGINAAAFLSSSGWSVIIASSNATPTVVTLSPAANGAPPTQATMLSAPTFTADNETSTNVQVLPTTLSDGQVTVSAYGVVELKP